MEIKGLDVQVTPTNINHCEVAQQLLWQSVSGSSTDITLMAARGAQLFWILVLRGISRSCETFCTVASQYLIRPNRIQCLGSGTGLQFPVHHPNVLLVIEAISRGIPAGLRTIGINVHIFTAGIDTIPSKDSYRSTSRSFPVKISADRRETSENQTFSPGGFSAGQRGDQH